MAVVGVVVAMGIPMRMALDLGRRLGRSTVGGNAAEHSDGAIANRLEAWPGGGGHDHREGEQSQRHQGEEANEERGSG